MTSLERLDVTARLTSTKAPEAGKLPDGRQDVADQKGEMLPVTGSGSSTPSQQELDTAVREVSNYFQQISRDINFSVDEELNQYVVTVTDRETGDLVRQIPSEEMLAISRFISEKIAENAEPKVTGLLINADA